jgi:HK97 family phage prohead protease
MTNEDAMTNYTPGHSMGLETKYTALSALTETGEIGRIRGYASRFGEPDQSGDVVARGAFAKSLSRLKEAGRTVKFLWQHDPTRPIGTWSDVRENQNGLWVAGEVLTDIQVGQEAALLMKAGAIDGLSIGYRVVRSQPNKDTGGRTLLEIDLWEVSLVTFPMLPTARAHQDLPVETSEDIAAALAEALAG